MNKYPRPTAGLYNPYFDRYLDLVDTGNVLGLLKKQGLEIMYFLRGLSEEQGNYRYAEGKWTVKEVIGHLIDMERMLAFRGLWMARGASFPQPEVDEDAWAAVSNAATRPWPELWREQHVARTDHVYLLRSLDEAAIARVGEVNGQPFSAAVVPWIIAGHERHHLDVLYTTYGLKQG
jgi:hypothetical protein|nr:DinB family protein [Candidatus Krumholzibacteria bacterium]